MAAGLSAGPGCASPLNPSLVMGDWGGRDVPAHFARLEIRFERTGSAIVGKACRYDGVTLTFDDAPVTLDGRTLTVQVRQGGLNLTFRGEFIGAGEQIAGAWTNSAGSRVILDRSGSYCAYARATRPLAQSQPRYTLGEGHGGVSWRSAPESRV